MQFTPDLMPGDVTGSIVYDQKAGDFEFREGPVFTNILLADEINRTPPKTQSALLEAMEERQVSVDGVSRPVPEPFLVAATQNPIEYEGTYTLPEAQLDRFLLKLVLEVPDRDVEVEVLRRHSAGFDPRDLAAAGVTPVLGAAELAAAQRAVASRRRQRRRAGLRRRPRPRHPAQPVGEARREPARHDGAARVGEGLGLALAATTRSPPTTCRRWCVPVWRHRIQLRPEAELEGVAVDAILRLDRAAGPGADLSHGSLRSVRRAARPRGRCRSS